MKVGQRGGTAEGRITRFIEGTEVPYQVEQSYIAIATGGIMGKGPGNSVQRNFLPEAYSDFVFCHYHRRIWDCGRSLCTLLILGFALSRHESRQ